MKTALIIGFVLLMQQGLDARQYPYNSASIDSSEEHKYVAVAATEGNLIQLEYIEASSTTPVVVQKCTGLYDPVCATNYKQVVLFYNACKYEQAKRRNANISWKTLPLKACNRLIRSQENSDEGVLGVENLREISPEKGYWDWWSQESWEFYNSNDVFA